MSAIITRYWPDLVMAEPTIDDGARIAHTIRTETWTDHAHPDPRPRLYHRWELRTRAGYLVAEGIDYRGPAGYREAQADLAAELYDFHAWLYEEEDRSALEDWRVTTKARTDRRTGARIWDYTIKAPQMGPVGSGPYASEEAALAAAHARIAAIRGADR